MHFLDEIIKVQNHLKSEFPTYSENLNSDNWELEELIIIHYSTITQYCFKEFSVAVKF